MITQPEQSASLFICTYSKQTDTDSIITCFILTPGESQSWLWEKPVACGHCVFLSGKTEKQPLCFAEHGGWLSLLHVEAIRSIIKNLNQDRNRMMHAAITGRGLWIFQQSSPTLLLQNCDHLLANLFRQISHQWFQEPPKINELAAVTRIYHWDYCHVPLLRG